MRILARRGAANLRLVVEQRVAAALQYACCLAVEPQLPAAINIPAQGVSTDKNAALRTSSINHATQTQHHHPTHTSEHTHRNTHTHSHTHTHSLQQHRHRLVLPDFAGSQPVNTQGQHNVCGGLNVTSTAVGAKSQKQTHADVDTDTKTETQTHIHTHKHAKYTQHLQWCRTVCATREARWQKVK